MTLHVSSRLISCLVVFLGIHLRLSMPIAAQSANVPPAAVALAERLDRLAAEFDRNRIDLHVPGAVLAIVRGEEVISLADSASMASNLNRLVCLPCG